MPIEAWIGFHVLVAIALGIDLGLANREGHVISVREALMWSAVWISSALIFNLGVYFFRGPQEGLEFFAGYLLEESLSADNLFVFFMLFAHFQVPKERQHRVLFWGIIGALALRGLMIGLGVAIIHRFHWVLYIFGAFLIYSGLQMLKHREPTPPEETFLVRLVKRFIPVAGDYSSGKFFIRVDGKLAMTPLFIVLLTVEATDVVFALDSIPAIFAVTTDPFTVYTSNIFAILGLRSLYFALAGVIDMFRYLKYGLCAILVFVGTKMLVADFLHVPIFVSLATIATILGATVAASLAWPQKMDPATGEPIPGQKEPVATGEPKGSQDG